MPTGHRKGKNAFLIRPASLCFAAVHASLDILTHPSSGFQGCSLGGPVFLHAFPRPPAPPHRADTPDPDPNTSARSARPLQASHKISCPTPSLPELSALPRPLLRPSGAPVPGGPHSTPHAPSSARPRTGSVPHRYRPASSASSGPAITLHCACR